MKHYRFVATAYHHVTADTLDDAIEAFNEMRRKGVIPESHRVRRIEVEDEHCEYRTVDHPLRAGDLEPKMEQHVH